MDDDHGIDAKPASPASRLPTAQRNALRKVFNRTEFLPEEVAELGYHNEFLPEEVAELGYHKLRLADGIGEKGLKTIASWLAEYGLDLVPSPTRQAPRRSPRHGSGGWTLKSAVRLLRMHGYEIQAPADYPLRRARKTLLTGSGGE